MQIAEIFSIYYEIIGENNARKGIMGKQNDDMGTKNPDQLTYKSKINQL